MSKRAAGLINTSGNTSKRVPIVIPAPSPTDVPLRSFSPSPEPFPEPSLDPSFGPSLSPSLSPSVSPSLAPSSDPSPDPSLDPSPDPSIDPIPIPVPSSSFDSSTPLHLESHVKTEGISEASNLTSGIMAAQVQLLYQLMHHQQQQQQLQERHQPQQRYQQQGPLRDEAEKIKKECSNYLATYYHDYVVGREMEFDVKMSFTHRTNRKIKALLYGQVREHRRFDMLTSSQIFTLIRNKFSYLKLSNRRSVYMANPSAFDARFPSAGKILTVDWTSDEEDGPEDEHGRTFVVKRSSFRSDEVLEFHKELQKAYKESSKKKGTPPMIRRRIENVEVELPDKLDHEDYPSWAFSSWSWLPDFCFWFFLFCCY